MALHPREIFPRPQCPSGADYVSRVPPTWALRSGIAQIRASPGSRKAGNTCNILAKPKAQMLWTDTRANPDDGKLSSPRALGRDEAATGRAARAGRAERDACADTVHLEQKQNLPDAGAHARAHAGAHARAHARAHAGADASAHAVRALQKAPVWDAGADARAADARAAHAGARAAHSFTHAVCAHEEARLPVRLPTRAPPRRGVLLRAVRAGALRAGAGRGRLHSVPGGAVPGGQRPGRLRRLRRRTLRHGCCQRELRGLRRGHVQGGGGGRGVR